MRAETVQMQYLCTTTLSSTNNNFKNKNFTTYICITSLFRKQIWFILQLPGPTQGSSSSRYASWLHQSNDKVKRGNYLNEYKNGLTYGTKLWNWGKSPPPSPPPPTDRTASNISVREVVHDEASHSVSKAAPVQQCRQCTDEDELLTLISEMLCTPPISDTTARPSRSFPRQSRKPAPSSLYDTKQCI